MGLPRVTMAQLEDVIGILRRLWHGEALAEAVAAARRGADRAGRDPASVRVWSVLATAGDHLDEEARLRKLVGRLATYLQGYGDLLVRVNGWDPAAPARFRADDLVSGHPVAFDAIGTPDQLRHVAGLLPDDQPVITASWLGGVLGRAYGTPTERGDAMFLAMAARARAPRSGTTRPSRDR